MNNFSRATSAFVLTASLLFSSVAAVAQTPATKPADDAQKSSQTTSDQKAPADQKQGEAKAEAQKATPRRSLLRPATRRFPKKKILT